MKSIKNWSLALIFAVSVGGAFASSLSPQTVGAAADDPCNKGFMGFPSWYRGLTTDPPECSIKTPGSAAGDLNKFIWKIGLNVVAIALVAVAWISGFATLYGGFLFITSRGNPDGAARARMTLLNAIIGLIISMVAVIAVDFIVTGLLG